MKLYHVLNHSLESRNLFLDSQDYARFVHGLYVFNDQRPISHLDRRTVAMSDIGCRTLLVDIHGWCLMKNHYHLLLSERVEGGIALFLRKLNVGYAKYYNERYRRHGFVFQGKTKKVPIEQHAHFLYVLHYVHLNPLDYLPSARKWRARAKGSIRSVREALRYLAMYRWSSYLDYCGKENFPSLITIRLFQNVPGEYYKDLSGYLRDSEHQLSSYMLE